MSVTITLPQTLETELKSVAEARNSSVEELALTILAHAVIASCRPSPEDIVAEIQTASPVDIDVRSANGSLAEALRDAPKDPNFDLEIWDHEWASVEAEMKALSRANDLAEGRR